MLFKWQHRGWQTESMKGILNMWNHVWWQNITMISNDSKQRVLLWKHPTTRLHTKTFLKMFNFLWNDKGQALHSYIRSHGLHCSMCKAFVPHHKFWSPSAYILKVPSPPSLLWFPAGTLLKSALKHNLTFGTCSWFTAEAKIPLICCKCG